MTRPDPWTAADLRGFRVALGADPDGPDEDDDPTPLEVVETGGES